MIEHYLDNSSTTPLCSEVKNYIESVLDNYGNPSSLHILGNLAEKEITKARSTILSVFSTPGTYYQKNNLIFTSCGSEANNLALTGVANSKPRFKGKKIITTSTEHDSVLKTCQNLDKCGFKVSYIESPNGKLDIDKLLGEVDNDTILVSVMLVNNETGAVNDINQICSEVKNINPNVIVHCDAVQGFMKIPYEKYSQADLITISGHKINALKGIGALFIKPNIHKLRAISPVIFGGGQESGLRSGTENVVGIASFGAAVKYYKDNFDKFNKLFDELYSYLIEEIHKLNDANIIINTPSTNTIAHHIINITVRGIRSETLLHHFSSNGIYISSGSACASNTNSKSHVLKSFGLSDKDIDSSIRISLGIQNTKDDIDSFISCLKEGIRGLQKNDNKRNYNK